MGRKIYRSFATDKVTEYSYIHQDNINIEKWKFEAFEGLVFPSSPLFVNDPYDCEFCFQADALENILDRETYLHLLERKFSLSNKEKDIILYSENIERAIQMVLSDHNAHLSSSWLDILKSSLNDCMDTIKDAVRVVCFSELYNSMLMWSHYAQDHKGYCIEYNFEERDVYYSHLYPVMYTKERYALSKKDVLEERKDVLYKTTCSKSDVWSYEKEWRIVIANYNRIIPQKIEYPEYKYVLDLKNNIKAFYLGAKISDDHKAEMIEFGKKNGIDVYQMVLSSTTYDLEAMRIE